MTYQASDFTDKKWDVFISHAHEDKEDLARPLAHLLNKMGFRVWFDEWELQIGDSLAESINQGLRDSEYGIVIISPSFIEKKWTRNELYALFSQEEADTHKILPIWHKVSAGNVGEFNPILTDRIALSSTEGLESLSTSIANKLGAASGWAVTSEGPLGVTGFWRGISGRLRISEKENRIFGSYDWYGKRWTGQIHGTHKDGLVKFDWTWDINDSKGSGFFRKLYVPSRDRMRNHFLVGGWAYEDDQEIVDIAIGLDPHRFLHLGRAPTDEYEQKMNGLHPWTFTYENELQTFTLRNKSA